MFGACQKKTFTMTHSKRSADAGHEITERRLGLENLVPVKTQTFILDVNAFKPSLNGTDKLKSGLGCKKDVSFSL